MNALLLTESKDSYATKSLVRAFDSREQNGEMVRIQANEFDIVYPRIGGMRYGCTIPDHLHNNVGIYSPIPSSGILMASDKFQTIQLCSQFGIRTPRTLLYSGGDSVDQLIEKIGGTPVVVKQLHGSQGKGVSILESMRAIKSTLDSFAKAGITVLVQEYIEAGGKDFRVFCVGGKIIAYYQRVAPKDEFRANISGGGHGVIAPITKEEEYICLLAAQALGLPVCGVDFLRAKDGQPYLIENNSNPGFKIENFTGISVSNAIVEFVEQDFAEHGKDRNKLQQDRRDTTQLLQSLTDEAKKNSKIIDPIVNDDYLKSILTQHKCELLD